MLDPATAWPACSPLRLLHRDPQRGLRRQSVTQCANLQFECAPQVERIAPRKGQRNYSGERWTATVARHVAFRSWVERDNLMVLDFETDVVAIAAQPFTLLWQVRGRERRHTPAFFARRSDGSALVVDVYGAASPSPRRAEARAALAEACDACGWDLRLPGVPEPVFAANLRWLSGYRHPRNAASRRVSDALLEAFASPAGLFDGAAAVGDPIAVLPALYHLMWLQQLGADLHTDVLDPMSVVYRVTAGTR